MLPPNLPDMGQFPILKTILSRRRILALCALISSFSLSASASSDNSTVQTVSKQQQSEKIKVSGQILDENSVPVAGASISETGSSNGTISDSDGKWFLTVSKGSTLEVSFLGFITESVTVNSAGNVSIVLRQDSQILDDVIVVGYGSVKKANLTGSVSKISEDAMSDRPIATVGEAFQGQLAGVSASASGGGLPGSDLTIHIRGINTINGTSTPLYVIDGVPRSNMSDINPSDIASVQVLKDASSSAIYGSRGASGVILIETKQGQGKPSVSFDSYYGFQNAERKLDIFDGEEYVAQQMYIRNVNHLRQG